MRQLLIILTLVPWISFGQTNESSINKSPGTFIQAKKMHPQDSLSLKYNQWSWKKFDTGKDRLFLNLDTDSLNKYLREAKPWILQKKYSHDNTIQSGWFYDPMPNKKPEGLYSMRIYRPDTTVNYFLRVEKIRQVKPIQVLK